MTLHERAFRHESFGQFDLAIRDGVKNLFKEQIAGVLKRARQHNTVIVGERKQVVLKGLVVQSG